MELLAKRVENATRAGRWFGALLPTPAIEVPSGMAGVTKIALDGGHEVLALPCPGHSDGSYLYFYEGVLIAGDSIQIDGDKLEFAMASFSVDMAANRRCIASLEAALAGRTVESLCTGHQGCTKEGRAMPMLKELIERAKGS